MSEEPRPTFYVAVVGASHDSGAHGPDALRDAARLAAWLDKATARAREKHNVALATFSHGPGVPWAHDRGRSVILIPRLGDAAEAEREMVEFSDALVVVGNPARWARLVRYANEMGKPVRFAAG